MAGLPAKKWSMSSPWNEVGIHPFHMESIRKIAGSVKTSKDETHPSMWSYHPPLYTICEFDTIRRLIEREGDVLLSPKDEGVRDTMRKLPQAVESWTR